MASNYSKAFSFPKRMLGWLLLGLVITVSIAVGVFASQVLFHHPQPGAASAKTGLSGMPAFAIILFIVMGMFFSFTGMISYAVVLATNCLTFKYDRPVWLKGFTLRLRLANIFVPLLLLLGIGSLATVLFGSILTIIGVPLQAAILIPFFCVLVPGQFLLAWFNIWMPIEKTLIRKRLSAIGIAPGRMNEGFYAGISDPSVSSFAKGLIEDDVGMMWLDADAIVYQGDARRLEIKRGQLVQIERKVDKGSMAAYAGAVHVILVWQDDKGAQNRTRIHVMNCFTLTGIARSLDKLADDLKRWQMRETGKGK
ncbi:MAG: hypothetical protein NT118_16335 [Lentisphaerae bacterium]|nr:hypothetical protein [Lentisphaerota bacterium]